LATGASARSTQQQAGAPAKQAAPASCRLIPIGSDHAGFELKQQLVHELRVLGYEPLDVGTRSTESVDYPRFAHRVARLVERGKAERGVLICGTGIGMSMTANRHANVRAAVCWSPEIAEVTRRHNDANVLALPARHVTPAQASEILQRFLQTPFDGGRHLRRIRKIELSARDRATPPTARTRRIGRTGH
jgi:ribose 5-phosphate isomerase B